MFKLLYQNQYPILESSKDTYKQTLKKTGIYGFFQILNVVLGVIRSKLTAILLGEKGVGIMGLLQSIIDLARSTTGLGLDSSATKEIATNGDDVIERRKSLYTVKVLYLSTAILGALFCILFSGILSRRTFGTDEYQIPIVLLSLATIFVTLTAWVIASLQGLRKVEYMAYASTVGSLLSFIVLIPAYYFLRLDGIVPMFIGTNAIIFLVCYYFYRKVKIVTLHISWRELIFRSREILKLGAYLVLGGIVFSGSLLLVKSHINRSDSIESAGLYQAVWTITSLFWSMALRTANSDYYPKLCSIIGDKIESLAYINRQTSLMMAVTLPIIVGMSIFADKILFLLYNSAFEVVAPTLSLHLIGAFYKIVITPLALVLLAKNRGALFLFTEFLFWFVYLCLFFLLFPHFGVLATGISYLSAYLLYIPIIIIVVYKKDKLELNMESLKKLLFITLLLMVLSISYFIGLPSIRLFQCLLLVPVCVYGIIEIKKYFDLNNIFSKFIKSLFNL